MRTIIRNNYDPHIGDYHERIIQDEAREKTWLFDCDGVYLDITAGRGDVKVVNELGDSEVFATSQKLVTDELGKKQDTLTAGDNITIEGNVISAGGGNYTAGYGLTLTGTEFAANTSVLATQTDLAGKQNALSSSQLDAVNSGINSTKVGQIATNASDIDTIEGKIPSAATAQNQLADKTYVDTADNGLQSQIDAISASSDVKDIVGTKAELDNYDTSTLGDNDIIKVLQDESENDATTYYRWSTSTNSFTLIGEEGPYYTKSQANALLDDKVDKVTGKGLSENDFTTTLKNKLDGIEAGAEVNTIDSISVNGTAVTPDANKNVALTIPDAVKTLTSADYNYHSSGDVDDCVALWKLETGLYVAGEQMLWAYPGSQKVTILQGSSVLIEKGSTNTTAIITPANDSEFPKLWVMKNNGSGAVSFPTNTYSQPYLLNSNNVINSLTSSLTAQPLSAAQGKYLNDNKADKTAFTGTDGTSAGTMGLVPAPATTDAGKFLKADGTWDTAGGGIITLASADYDYPTSGTKTGVDINNLNPGLYTTSEDTMTIHLQGASDIYINKGDYLLVTGDGVTSVKNYYIFGRSVGITIYDDAASTVGKAWRTLAGVYNVLNSTATEHALSANQGRILNNNIGTLSSLTTTDKTSAVAAINEVNSHSVTLLTNSEFNTILENA